VNSKFIIISIKTNIFFLSFSKTNTTINAYEN